MPRLLAVLPLLALLAGCESHREYYEARYVPASGDEAFSSIARTRWAGDKQVFELPSNPPALADLHRERKPCAKPGPRFKPDAMGGYHDAVNGNSAVSGETLGAMAARGPGPGPGPEWAYPVGTMGDRQPATIYKTDRADQLGAMGPYRRELPVGNPGLPLGVMRDQAKDDYCLPGESTIPPRH